MSATLTIWDDSMLVAIAIERKRMHFQGPIEIGLQLTVRSNDEQAMCWFMEGNATPGVV